jgi:hypothetical protein
MQEGRVQDAPVNAQVAGANRLFTPMIVGADVTALMITQETISSWWNGLDG